MASPTTSLPSLAPVQAAELLRSSAAMLAEQLIAALPGMLAPALEKLNSRADGGDAGAKRLLSSGREELRRAFGDRLKQEQADLIGRLFARDKPAAKAAKISAESLSLVDDDAAAPDIVVSKVARRMRGALEARLGDIHLIVAHLAARETLRPDDDPLTPEVCLRALLAAARDSGLEAGGWEAFLAAMEAPMAGALGSVLDGLREHFRKHRLDAGEVRRDKALRQSLGRSSLSATTVQGTGTVAGASSDPTTQGSAARRLGWMDEVPRVSGVPAPPRTLNGGGFEHTGGAGWATVAEVQASLDNMLQRMSASTRGGPPPVALPAAGRPPPDLLAAINEMQRMGAEEAARSLGASTRWPAGSNVLPDLAGAGLGPPTVSGAADAAVAGAAGAVPTLAEPHAWRDVLLAKSTRTVDKLTIEIVGMLFEHVLQDKQVPAEIKAVLSRLQFPVLKVALTDAEFFASSAHPARRLIDRLASTAAGWEPYGDENQRYKAEVERVVQQVLERFDKDVGTFEQLLEEFEKFIAEMPTRETDPIARAKAALEEAEKREVLVINTTIQVRRAFEHVELEPYLREFLVGPWVQALVTATLRDEKTPGFSKAFRQVIHDVVWSVQPKVSAEERKRLVALIPEMTRVLRDGMALARMGQDEQQAFLKQLMASHAIAVRPVDQATYIKSRVATGDLRQKLEQMHITSSVPLNAAEGVRVSPNAVRRAAEAHAAPLVIAEPLPNVPATSFEQDADFEEQIASWQRGDWFSLYDGSQTIKVKLRWISPLRTLFMFNAGDDKNARVLSPESIKSYLKQGWLKPLEAEPLMKRAVDRVVGELERSPKRAEELAEKIGVTKAPTAGDRIATTVAAKLQ